MPGQSLIRLGHIQVLLHVGLPDIDELLALLKEFGHLESEKGLD